jgi:hypothetical protein
VTLLETPCAMTDLFALSKCRFLLGSGGSSFSAWASFIEKIPTTIEGQSLNWFKLSKNSTDHWVETYNPDLLDKKKLSYIKEILIKK